MSRLFALALLAGCGRVGFDPSDGPSAAAHDEDGDGVPDVNDDCPHVPDPAQLDGDHDGVGDVCDPEPTMPRQRITWFVPTFDSSPCIADTMTGGWTSTGDALQLAGASIATLLCTVVPISDTDIWIGADVTAWTGFPRQVALDISPTAQTGYYYGDLFETSNPVVSVNHYDGTTYTTLQSVPTPTFHPGSVTFHLAVRTAATGVAQFRHHVEWPGEPYDVRSPASGYTGSDRLLVVLQHVDVSIRYLLMIETTP